jgi:hypothetical protein
MSIPSPTDAEAFYTYFGLALQQGERETPPEALLRTWRIEREFEDACGEIQQGIADMEAGLGRPASDVFTDLRRKHGIEP